MLLELLHRFFPLGRARALHSLLATAPEKAADRLIAAGNRAENEGRLREACDQYRSAVTTAPKYAAAHLNLGIGLEALGHTDNAIESYKEVLTIDPGNPYASYNLGKLLYTRGALQEAAELLRSALESKPEFPEANVVLSNVYASQGNLLGAATALDMALKQRPDWPGALYNYATVLRNLGRLAEAESALRRAVTIDPANAEALQGLGHILVEQSKFDDAVACYEKALALNPDLPDAQINLGNILSNQDRSDEAGACYRKALALNPDLAEAHSGLGNVLRSLNRHKEAIDCYERAVAIKPDYLGAQLLYVHVCAQQTLWHPEREQDLLARFRDYKNRDEIVPFPFLHFVESAAVQKEIACLYAGSFLPADNTPVPLRPFAPGGDRRLRVAYFSSDFHSHATSYLMAELFELHDPSRFDITLLSYGPDDASSTRKRIAASAKFVDLRGLRSNAVREQIRARQPDILVDLKGYTAGTLSKLLARRLAPVQVNWLGYPGTMGADFIDYIIADPFIVPEGAENFYSEKIVRLPDCYQPNDRKRPIATPRTRAAYGLPEAGLVLFSSNQSAKIRPDIFALWLDVLDEVKDSVLWFMAGPEAERNFRRIAVERGIDPGRLIVAPRLPLAEHLARYQVADLALDTYPYGSHTTASDALWAGCPVVALAGETFASRVSGSLLHAMGFAELVTNNRGDYRRLILRLAQSGAYRDEVRARLKRNRDTAALFDTPRFVRNLERAYEAMMAHARAGLPAAHISL